MLPLREALRDLTRLHSIARRLPLRFDPAALASDLARVPDSSWVTYSGAYFDSGRYLSVNVSGTELFREVVSSFQAPIRMVRLTRLLPGGNIRRHRDTNVGRDLFRVHVPVATDGSVEFRVAGVNLPMQIGEAWRMDPRFPHEVHNRSGNDRVHLIIDLPRSAALDDLLARGHCFGRHLLLDYFALDGLRWLASRSGISGLRKHRR